MPTTPPPGAHRYIDGTSSPTADRPLHVVLDRVTGDIAYQSRWKDNTDRWIWANHHQRPHITTGETVFCLSGNVAEEDGFPPCDATGREIEPDEEWADLLLCNRCGLIFKLPTGEVTSRALHDIYFVGRQLGRRAGPRLSAAEMWRHARRVSPHVYPRNIAEASLQRLRVWFDAGYANGAH